MAATTAMYTQNVYLDDEETKGDTGCIFQVENEEPSLIKALKHIGKSIRTGAFCDTKRDKEHKSIERAVAQPYELVEEPIEVETKVVPVEPLIVEDLIVEDDEEEFGEEFPVEEVLVEEVIAEGTQIDLGKVEEDVVHQAEALETISEEEQEEEQEAPVEEKDTSMTIMGLLLLTLIVATVSGASTQPGLIRNSVKVMSFSSIGQMKHLVTDSGFVKGLALMTLAIFISRAYASMKLHPSKEKRLTDLIQTVWTAFVCVVIAGSIYFIYSMK